MVVTIVEAAELQELLTAEPTALLLSVDSEDVHNEARLPDSSQLAVYEMGFVDRFREMEPDQDRLIILYSAGKRSRASSFAAEKLERAGYRRVYDFKGGVDRWREAGGEVIGTGAPAQPHPASGRLQLDLENSEVRWVGRNLANQHAGAVGLAGGWIELQNGVLLEGELAIAMDQISCSDITDTKLNGMLLDHLRDHDFFDVERHPQAWVRLTQVRHLPDETAGRPNYNGTARLELRGVDKSLRFSLVGGGDTQRFSLQGAVGFDRTRWGVLYGSAKFFDRLGMHLVNDFIDINVRLNFSRIADLD